MAAETTFTLNFKTIAELTGLDRLIGGVQQGVKKIEVINTQLQTMAFRANTALTAIGLGLSVSKLTEYSNKALEAGRQQQDFTRAVLASKDGSMELVEELIRFNEQLEDTTGTNKGTSRAIEQLFLRAGAGADQVKSATRAVIEFAASSAGTVQPLELASVMARRLSGAADATDISLSRLGIRAKTFDDAIAEMAKRGGDAAETFVRASGGMVQYKDKVEEAEIAIGRFVNTIKVPFLTALTGTLIDAKDKLDGVTKSATEAGDTTESWGVKFAIASAIAGHSIGNLGNVATGLMSVVEAAMAYITLLGTAATAVVVNATETIANKTIDALKGLAKFAAQTANTLSGGLIPDTSPQIDKFAESLKTKVTGASDAIRKSLSIAVDEGYEVGRKALDRLQKSVDAMTKDGPKVLDPAFIAKVREQYKQLFDVAGNFKGVKPGSGVVPLGDAGGEAGKKAATEALTQAKYQLAAAQQAYETELQTTKLLEESGAITTDQANARRLQATRDYIAELTRLREMMPQLIAQQEALGNAKGAAELKLQYGELTQKILEAQGVLANSTVFGQMRAQIRQLAAEWGNVGKMVGQFLTQQFQNFAATAGQIISNLIFRTGSWKQSILQLGQAFVTQLATMLIQWILSQTIMAALSAAFGKTNAKTANKFAAESAAAWAPAATSAAIASYGAAAWTGLAAYLAAVAAGAAGAAGISKAGGFQRGGWTGSGPETGVAGPVHYEEVVFPKRAVEYWGRDTLVNMALGTLPQPAGYQRGGVGGSAPGSGASGGPFGSAPTVNVAFFDDRQALEQWLRSQQGTTIIYDAVTRRRIDLGI